MRAVGAARWFLSSASIVALAAVFAPERALATCTFNGPGPTGIVALGGAPPDACSAAAGAYNGLPAAHPPQGVGFYAAAGGSITATTGQITITTPNSGVEANGGQISLTNDHTDVSTSGASAHGFFAENGGLITLNNITTTASTTGDFAYGFYAQSGGQITVSATPLDLVEVFTEGLGAFGVYASGAGSSITVDTVASITTVGAGADGVVADADGVVNLASGGAVTTGFILDPDASPATAVGVLANTGGRVTLTGVFVSTSGANSPGIEATGGDGSTGGQSSVTTAVLPGETPTPTAIATTGDYSPGAEADTGGKITLNGGSVTTSGTGSTGLYATGVDGTTGATSTITATRSRRHDRFRHEQHSRRRPGRGRRNRVADRRIGPDLRRQFAGNPATGGDGPTGRQSSVTTAVLPGETPTPTTITTTGDNSAGAEAHTGGQITLNGGAVTTSGIGSPGLYATGVDGTTGAKSTIMATGVAVATGASPGPGTGAVGVLAEAGGQAFLTGGSVTTNGNSAYGVVAHGGGFVQLNGTSISTIGDGSGGLAINGAGSEIDATNVTISTIGGSDSSTGTLQHSYGVYNGPFMSESESFPAGGVAKLTDTSVSTRGDQMHGVNTSTGGSTTILGGLIMTAGRDANAIYTQNHGITTVGASAAGPTTLITTGNDAYAVVAVSGGFVSLTGSRISTTGTIGSGGIAVHDAGSEVDATNVSITTLRRLRLGDRCEAPMASTTGPLANPSRAGSPN